MLVVTNEIDLPLMKNNQKNIIETAPVDPLQLDPHPNKITDFTDSIGTFMIILGLLMAIKKLWRSIGKLRKQQKCNPKLLFPIFSALWAIWKAIEPMNDR